MPLTVSQEEELTALRAARLRLISGQQVTRVTANGRTVEYSQASLARLEAAIDELAGLAQPRRRRGAIGFRL